MVLVSTDGSVHGAWNYYWHYTRTRTGIHAAATAALTALGLLAYFHRGFVVLAIAAYVLPPLYLYLTTDELERERAGTNEDPNTDADIDGTDTDSDSDGADTDTDTDSDDGDTDTDSDDGDTDTDG